MSEANVEHLAQRPSIYYMHSPSLDVSTFHPQAWEISRETRMQPKSFGCRWGNTALAVMLSLHAWQGIGEIMGVCKWCWLYRIDRWTCRYKYTHSWRFVIYESTSMTDLIFPHEEKLEPNMEKKKAKPTLPRVFCWYQVAPTNASTNLGSWCLDGLWWTEVSHEHLAMWRLWIMVANVLK